jgi:hypothetical protein
MGYVLYVIWVAGIVIPPALEYLRYNLHKCVMLNIIHIVHGIVYYEIWGAGIVFYLVTLEYLRYVYIHLHVFTWFKECKESYL